MEIKILLGIIIGGLIVIIIKLFWGKNSSSEQLVGYINALPEIIREKLTNTLLENHSQIIDKAHQNNQELIKAFAQLKHELNLQEHISNTNLIERFNKFANELKGNLSDDAAKLNEILRFELIQLNAKVEDRLREGFENTSKTFSSVLERLAKIDEAQKKIDALSTNIISLQDILADKKSRGIFGEIQLNQIIRSIFGDGQDLYSIQHKLLNGNIADVALFAPEPIGTICIDAKFPLENYKRMLNNELADSEKLVAKRDFETNIKRHIDDIANKYIVINVTGAQAIMFIPAEAIFAQIHAYHHNLIEYAQKRNVWLTSPTTLMAMLTTIQVVVKNIEQAKHSKVIQEHIAKLGEEFSRYKNRWDNLAKHIDTVAKDVKEIHTTTDKIDRKFHEIAQVKIIEKI